MLALRCTLRPLAILAILAACSKTGESASTDTASVVGEAAREPVPAADTSAAAPQPGAPSIGVDQMPASATITVAGPPNADDWNGTFSLNSNAFGCGVNTYPKMINFNIADEKGTGQGILKDLRIGSNDGPDVGGSTSKFSLTLDVNRPGPSLSINPENDPRASGTLTVVENANGNSRVKFTAREGRGIQVDGEFTCVPRK